MTQQELLLALKTAITTDTDAGVIAALAIRNDIGIADIYNQKSNPVVLAWNTITPMVDVDESTPWVTFDTLTAGKRDSWTMFLARARDFTKLKVRAWIIDIWGAATTDSASEKILLAGTETALYGQVRIGGTTKTTGSVSALDRLYSGTFNHSMVSAALNLA